MPIEARIIRCGLSGEISVTEVGDLETEEAGRYRIKRYATPASDGGSVPPTYCVPNWGWFGWTGEEVSGCGFLSLSEAWG